MKYFVEQNSIVRKIWAKSDTILFIFAGSAAEFALNKAVDWLYFTGRLPADPLGRLFSTVAYSRKIIFSEYDHAIHAIDQISAIHKNVEESRGSKIPDWAYRDVLFMLIDYSIRSYEVLERKLSKSEKQEVYKVFLQVGNRMQINNLPADYEEWEIRREEHLRADLIYSHFSADLYVQYKEHLGYWRYHLLKQVQKLLVPQHVSNLLLLNKLVSIKPILFLYKLFRQLNLSGKLKEAIMPSDYRLRVKELDIADPH